MRTMKKASFITIALLGLWNASAQASDLQPETLGAANPGALEMFTYVPPNTSAGAPLVVVLHGCGQSADEYVTRSGWQTIADQYGLVLLAPQQTLSNQLNRCFNWYETGDNARDVGEALSIHNMVEQVVSAEGIDASRVFVTGLSAGGFMTTAMLAAYPELFSAGAVVAGGPYGCADSLTSALDCVGGSVTKSPDAWAALVTSAAPSTGVFPRLSVWHGDADSTVAYANAGELAKQWTALHGLDVAGGVEDEIAGHGRVRYGVPAAVEVVTLGGMGHAVAVDEGVCGSVGAFASDVGVCSSIEIARFWGLLDMGQPPANDDAGPGGGGADAGAGGGAEDGGNAGDDGDGGGCSLAPRTSGGGFALVLFLGCFAAAGRRRDRD